MKAGPGRLHQHLRHLRALHHRTVAHCRFLILDILSNTLDQFHCHDYINLLVKLIINSLGTKFFIGLYSRVNYATNRPNQDVRTAAHILLLFLPLTFLDLRLWSLLVQPDSHYLWLDLHHPLHHIWCPLEVKQYFLHNMLIFLPMQVLQVFLGTTLLQTMQREAYALITIWFVFVICQIKSFLEMLL